MLGSQGPEEAPPVSSHGESNLLFDPYLGRKPPPPPKLPFAPAALTALLLSWVPIGSLAAVPIGVVGLRQTRSRGVRGRGLAIAALVIGTLSSIAYGAAGVWAAVRYVDASRLEARAEQARRDRRVRDREDERDQGAVTQQAPLIERLTPRPNLPKDGTVPKDTVTTERAKITVVTLGIAEKSIKSALMREIANARAEGEDVMVMTLRTGCEPCEGVLKSLDDPRMQAALEKVRIVVVDLIFHEELSALHISVDGVPGFSLLAADATPRDAVDGGEWGADIAENIAPVLGPFVRGNYKQRKKPFQPGPGGGVFL